MDGPILLCTATTTEARACHSGIKRSGTSDYFEVLKTGMGLIRASQALKSRLLDASRPAPVLIISTGFAGSLVSEIPCQSWVIGRTLHAWNHSGEEQVISLSDASFGQKLSTYEVAWIPAKIFSAQKFLTTKTVTPQGIQVVDLESFSLAQVAKTFNISFQILRLISDTPSKPIPKAILTFSEMSLSSSELEWTKKLKCTTQGLKEVFHQPIKLSRFLLYGMRLPFQLETGWSIASKALVQPQLLRNHL